MANYILLERIELNASAASVTFSNIPQTGYTDLKIVGSVLSSSTSPVGNVYMTMALNGVTTDRTFRRLYGGGSSAGSDSGSIAQAGTTNTSLASSSIFASHEIYIPNYLSSNFKSISIDSAAENNSTANELDMIAGLWSQTAAINSITFALSSGSFVQYSTFSLYGLAAVGTTPVIAPKAAGGNIIDYDGTYWIHTFLTSGAFVPAIGLTCDYLVVAGGGGGGNTYGGGGGAGGFRTATAQTVTSSTSYTVTVGAGGAGAGGTSAQRGDTGSNSIFSTTTSSGGGGGGGNASPSTTAGANGGSGGGGAGTGTPNVGGSGNAGSYSPVEGKAGGNANGSPPYYGSGGGGGASADGAAGTSTTGGNGGAGTSNSFSGSAVTYAGGGGSSGYNDTGTPGTGGAGGGGNAATSSLQAVAGTANTGGGGGGGGNTGRVVGGNGGSGIVIIRYLAA